MCVFCLCRYLLGNSAEAILFCQGLKGIREMTFQLRLALHQPVWEWLRSGDK